MIFTNGRVILTDTIRDDLEVEICDGKIAEFRPRGCSPDATDLRGDFLAPGFVDLHVHGALGRDVMEMTLESLQAICDYHGRRGTTSLLLTTVTADIKQIVSVLARVEEYRSQIPQITGVHVEGPFISPQKAGAQNSEFICEPIPELTDQLLAYADIIKRVTLAPEIKGALQATERFVSSGINVSGGHSDAWDDEARAGFECGMRSATHTFNCMSSGRRRGVYRIAGLLEFALGEPEMNCELIADGHHVSPTLMKMAYRAKGPAGISLVTDATAGAGLPEGTRFELSGKKCVVRNGVGLLSDQSALAGSVTSMIDLVRTMVRDVGIPLSEAVAMASRTPARQMGLPKKGEIAIGNDADLVVFSPEFEVKQTFVGGEQIYPR